MLIQFCVLKTNLYQVWTIICEWYHTGQSSFHIMQVSMTPAWQPYWKGRQMNTTFERFWVCVPVCAPVTGHQIFTITIQREGKQLFKCRMDHYQEHSTGVAEPSCTILLLALHQRANWPCWYDGILPDHDLPGHDYGLRGVHHVHSLWVGSSRVHSSHGDSSHSCNAGRGGGEGMEPAWMLYHWINQAASTKVSKSTFELQFSKMFATLNIFKGLSLYLCEVVEQNY